MNGYLTFLQSLSAYQQRAEIGHLAFAERGDCSWLVDELLKVPAVAAFSESLGVDPSVWTEELRHYAEEPDVFGTPLFGDNQCVASFSFRYVERIRSLDHSGQNLVVEGMIYIDDNQRAVIRTLAASSTREESRARARLVALGVDPETLNAVGHDAEMARKMPYLDYLQTLLPQQRREAVFDLAERAWPTGGPADNPSFISHAKLAPELQRLRIADLGISDRCHQVGPVEFEGYQCTAPLWYPLYGRGYDEDGNFEEDSFGYYVEVHLLANVSNRPGGGGDISIKDLWFRVENIDEPPSDTVIPLLVP